MPRIRRRISAPPPARCGSSTCRRRRPTCGSRAAWSQGDAITPFYDPMIAKLVAWGPDRPAALARLGAALAECRIAGITSNLGFLGRLVGAPGDAGGRARYRLRPAPRRGAAAAARRRRRRWRWPPRRWRRCCRPRPTPPTPGTARMAGGCRAPAAGWWCWRMARRCIGCGWCRAGAGWTGDLDAGRPPPGGWRAAGGAGRHRPPDAGAAGWRGGAGDACPRAPGPCGWSIPMPRSAARRRGRGGWPRRSPAGWCRCWSRSARPSPAARCWRCWRR